MRIYRSWDPGAPQIDTDEDSFSDELEWSLLREYIPVFPAEAANYPTGDAYVDSLSEAEQDALAEAEDAYLASLS
ncbi:MAG: hypothetical protein LBC97_15795, partial [Bifidobacteriaceae bacterium]|nr:hypothetical protein [Bifidobacteriaceae bacterium]